MMRSWHRRRGYGSPEFLLSVGLTLCAALGLAGLLAMGQFTWFLLYLVATLVTVLVLRAIPVEPGAVLSRRPARRGLVLLIGATCCLLTSIPSPLGTWYLLPTLFLIFCNVMLGRATQRISAAPVQDVDEWQESMRNRAHVVAYWILAAVVVLGVGGAYVISYATRAWLADSFGVWIALAELLLFLPAMVVAWTQSDPVVEYVRPRGPIRWSRYLVFGAVAVELLLPVVSGLAMLVLPPQVNTTPRPAADQVRGCSYLGAITTVGWVFQAQLPISADVCWTGVRAVEQWGMNRSDCNPETTSGLLVTTVSCTRRLLPNGTLYFDYTARLESPGLPFVQRDVSLKVAVSRTGRLLAFP